MYLAPACVAWGVLGVWLQEWPAMAASNALALIAAKPWLYLAAAAMGFGVNLLAYVVIQMSSCLTLKVGLQYTGGRLNIAPRQVNNRSRCTRCCPPRRFWGQ